MESATVAQEPQHIMALRRANEIRWARAEMKRQIGRGELPLADVIREVPECLASITLAELLSSQRRWGRVRARKFLGKLGLGERKKLGDLTERQKDVLAANVERGGKESEIFDPVRHPGG